VLGPDQIVPDEAVDQLQPVHVQVGEHIRDHLGLAALRRRQVCDRHSRQLTGHTRLVQPLDARTLRARHKEAQIRLEQIAGKQGSLQIQVNEQRELLLSYFGSFCLRLLFHANIDRSNADHVRSEVWDVSHGRVLQRDIESVHEEADLELVVGGRDG